VGLVQACPKNGIPSALVARLLKCTGSSSNNTFPIATFLAGGVVSMQDTYE